MAQIFRSTRRLALLAAFAVFAGACVLPPDYVDPGYHLIIHQVYIPNGQVAIQLVEGPNIERVRAPATAAAAEIQAATGLRVSVAPGTTSNSAYTEGFIKIRIEDSGCITSPNACAPMFFFDSVEHGWYAAMQGVVVGTPMLTQPDDRYLRWTIYHELGHAFGLAHYFNKFDGAWQVMGRYTPQAHYGAGDLNGLRAVKYLTSNPGGRLVVPW